MAILDFQYTPILVDISDTVIGTTVVKRRALRTAVHLPDNPLTPCLMDLDIIPFARLADGSYGEELTGGVFTRCKRTIGVSSLRLVDSNTGRILASRFAADNSLRPDADWQADIDRIAADNTVQAMYQHKWFSRLMQQVPVEIDPFSIQYIHLADASGDLG